MISPEMARVPADCDFSEERHLAALPQLCLNVSMSAKAPTKPVKGKTVSVIHFGPVPSLPP
jgi:hypothetical protein